MDFQHILSSVLERLSLHVHPTLFSPIHTDTLVSYYAKTIQLRSYFLLLFLFLGMMGWHIMVVQGYLTSGNIVKAQSEMWLIEGQGNSCFRFWISPKKSVSGRTPLVAGAVWWNSPLGRSGEAESRMQTQSPWRCSVSVPALPQWFIAHAPQPEGSNKPHYLTCGINPHLLDQRFLTADTPSREDMVVLQPFAHKQPLTCSTTE